MKRKENEKKRKGNERLTWMIVVAELKNSLAVKVPPTHEATSIRWWGTWLRSCGDTLSVPISSPVNTCAESPEITSTGSRRARARDRRVFPTPVGPPITSTRGRSTPPNINGFPMGYQWNSNWQKAQGTRHKHKAKIHEAAKQSSNFQWQIPLGGGEGEGEGEGGKVWFKQTGKTFQLPPHRIGRFFLDFLEKDTFSSLARTAPQQDQLYFLIFSFLFRGKEAVWVEGQKHEKCSLSPLPFHHTMTESSF